MTNNEVEKNCNCVSTCSLPAQHHKTDKQSKGLKKNKLSVSKIGLASACLACCLAPLGMGAFAGGLRLVSLGLWFSNPLKIFGVVAIGVGVIWLVRRFKSV